MKITVKMLWESLLISKFMVKIYSCFLFTKYRTGKHFGFVIIGLLTILSITIYAGNLLEQQTLVRDLSRKVRRMMSVLSGRDGPICNV